LGLAALGARQYDVAIKEFRTVEYEFGLGWAYGQMKQYQEAIAAFERTATPERQPFVVAQLAWAFGLAGRKQEALKAIDELNEFARYRYVAPSLFVHAYVGVGDKERALTWLEKAYEERDCELRHLKIDPTLDPLRSEPRFQAILRRMNFPP